MRTTSGLLLALGAAACASAPPVPPVPPAPSFNDKMAWILRFEDQRALHDPPTPPAPPPPPPARGAGARVAAPTPPPPAPPDLLRLLTDAEARVRRRAALAVGRVGLGEGVQPLAELLTDDEPEVRQMAAFALGLIGDRRAVEPLVAALGDPSPLVQASAAEALGLIGDARSAGAIARMASQIVSSGALGALPSDDGDRRRDSPAAAYRLGVFALARLKAYDALAAATLDETGQPRVRWWPVAYALQRLEDRRAIPALLTLLNEAHPYTRAFAVRGLGATGDASVVPALVPLVAASDRAVAFEAIRALGRLGGRAGAPALVQVIQAAKADPQLRLEAVTALGSAPGEGVSDLLLDLLGDASPPLRAAAIRSLARLDPEGFITVLSGLDPDPQWSVRAALADVLGALSPDAGLPRLRMMLDDKEPRVIPSVLRAIAALRAPDAAAIMLERLKADDPLIRAAAAEVLAELKPADGVPALVEAFRRGERDTTYSARAAALSGLAAYGALRAAPVLDEALGDKDWALRVRAVTLMKQIDPSTDPNPRIRPAPTYKEPAFYEAARLVDPPVSTHAYIDTDRGTIQIELAVLDAPLTVENFVTLARKGFFDGVVIHRVVPDFVIQGGDPRGTGEGGPGYTIRDELSETPFLRGAVGMALDWPDTGGSQFFITHSPQPQLDAKYTVFARVISGIEVVDQIEAWDVIRRVRIWDGETPPDR